jgi:hypothetical protein
VVLLTALERLWVPDSKTRPSSSPIHQPVRLTVPTRRDPTNPRCSKDRAADRCLAAESRRERLRGMLATDRQRTRVVFIQYSILVVRQAGSGHNKRQRCCGRVSIFGCPIAHTPMLHSLHQLHWLVRTYLSQPRSSWSVEIDAPAAAFLSLTAPTRTRASLSHRCCHGEHCTHAAIASSQD